jgi:hypothetical protein
MTVPVSTLTRYPTSGAPPRSVGALHETVAYPIPLLVTKAPTAVEVVAGIAEITLEWVLPLSMSLKKYRVPFVRPVAVLLEVASVIVAVVLHEFGEDICEL